MNSGRRRVLIIVENLPVPFDRRVWQQARTLSSAGYEVSIICPATKRYPLRYEALEGIAIYRHPFPVEAEGPTGYLIEYANALFWQLVLACRIFVSRGFDVIQGCNPPDTIFLIGAIFKVLGKRYIFDQHDLAPEIFQAKFSKAGPLHRVLLLLERLSFNMADVAIVTNESFRRLAMERSQKAPNRVFIVRNGPDLDRVKLVPANPDLRRGRRFLIGYVGVIGKQEGIDLLLRVVYRIVHDKQRMDIQFAVIGGGTDLEQAKAYAAKLGIGEYVTFTGYIFEPKHLCEYLSTADVCVNPDIANAMNDRSTSVKIMEYMALSKPIVQFDLTEGRYTAGDAALYARHNDVNDFAEKVLYLLEHPNEREQMGALGRRRVEQELEWSHQAPRLLAAYELAYAQPMR